ncbi:DUF6446 family protein [Paracoccus seriniphilus]|uniref:Histidine kinase n=1 Tax=Paracoccus seriniphilus TaxID=184748 RepID=A0A239PSK1_9RHOB|nr:DUF6446 family protein [Paracoccus seriniphilus]WCR12888.1 histidine kinase [Paracoccus seriniphilus]SNT72687.1 hypothetical protein SAMN05444959_103185 [Paracoccus seriniphilus]
MNGKIVGLALIGSMAAAGVGMWYAQEYGFYDRIDPDSPAAQVLVQTTSGPVPLNASSFEGIDANSSPLRWRACLRLDGPLPGDVIPFDDPQPLNGPGWFDCYDAASIGSDLESGAAIAILSQSEIRPDVDRILAVYPDGRIYGWHQFNDKTPERGVMD